MEYKEYRDEINHIFSHYAKRGFVDYYNCRGLRERVERIIYCADDRMISAKYVKGKQIL